MSTKSIVSFIALGFAIFSAAACSSAGDGAGNTSEALGKQAVQCFKGTWTRCSDEGTSSTLVTLNSAGNTISESIESFNSNDTCSGANDGSVSFNAVVELGAIGESTAVSGATEVQLTPDVDFLGCGSNQPAFTLLKFSSDCKSMQVASGAPTCDFASRPTALDAAAFTKN